MKTAKAGRKSAKRLPDTKRKALRADRIAHDTRNAIRQHAREEFEKHDPPREACGFIATDGKRQRAFRSPNLSTEPHRAFRTCPKAWRKVEDKGWEVIAIYHSHVNESPSPSPGDKTEAEKKGLPFVIVGMPTDAWDFYAPKGWKAELNGRPFIHGILDCYTYVLDYFAALKPPIELPDFDRPDDWWLPMKRLADGTKKRTNDPGEVIGPPLNLYLDNILKAGFVEVQDLKRHDVLLIQMARSTVINHSAVFLGDGWIGHHLSERISKVEPYVAGHSYSRGVIKIVRHKSLM